MEPNNVDPGNVNRKHWNHLASHAASVERETVNVLVTGALFRTGTHTHTASVVKVEPRSQESQDDLSQ